MSKISAKARRELIATVAERYQVGTGVRRDASWTSSWPSWATTASVLSGS